MGEKGGRGTPRRSVFDTCVQWRGFWVLFLCDVSMDTGAHDWMIFEMILVENRRKLVYQSHLVHCEIIAHCAFMIRIMCGIPG